MSPGVRRVRAGFTLLELLVALAVFGLAAAALLSLSAENTRLSSHLADRALAGLLAENLAAEALSAPAPPPDDSGTALLAGREWRWSRTSQGVAEGALLRIDIAVSSGDDQARDSAVLTVFRGADG